MACNQLVADKLEERQFASTGTSQLEVLKKKPSSTTKVRLSIKQTKFAICCLVICLSSWHRSTSFELTSHEKAADLDVSSGSSGGGSISNKLNKWPATVDSDNNNNNSDDISDDTDTRSDTKRISDAILAIGSANNGTTKGRLTSNRRLMTPSNGTVTSILGNSTDGSIDYDQLVDNDGGREPISVKRLILKRDIAKALEADAKIVTKALEADAKIIKSAELKKIKKKIKKKLKALKIDKLRAELEDLIDHAIHYTAPLYDDNRVHYDGFVQPYYHHYDKPAPEVSLSASKSVVKREIIESKIMKKVEKKLRKKVKKIKHKVHHTVHHAAHQG